MRRFVVILMMCGLALMAFTAAANARSTHRHIEGSMSGNCAFVPDTGSPTGMWTLSSAVGTVSPLGTTILMSSHPSDFKFSGGHMELVTTSGDRVCIDYAGEGPQPGPDTTSFDVEVDFTIVGGTGRYVRASGGGHLTVTLQFLGFDVPVWPAVFTYHGKISYGHPHCPLRHH